MAGSEFHKGSQGHLSMTLPVTRLSPHRPEWMSKRFILFIKGAMLFLSEKYTEIFIGEVM